MGNMLAKAQMQIFADPDTMARMAQTFMRAASVGASADGLLKTLPPQGQELLSQITSALASQLSAKPGAADQPGLASASAPVVPPASSNGPKKEPAMPRV